MTDLSSNIMDKAHQAGDDAAEAVESTAERVKNTVRKGVETAKDTAAERADQARKALSDTGHRLSDTLLNAAENAPADSLTSRTLHAAANGLSEASRRVENVSLDTIYADARELARRNPVATAAIAAVAGFALMRMMRAGSRDHA
jgi:ElaB/YqjD/DUF883 family membrane-anchored ribosome-binding protein